MTGKATLRFLFLGLVSAFAFGAVGNLIGASYAEFQFAGQEGHEGGAVLGWMLGGIVFPFAMQLHKKAEAKWGILAGCLVSGLFVPQLWQNVDSTWQLIGTALTPVFLPALSGLASEKIQAHFVAVAYVSAVVGLALGAILGGNGVLNFEFAGARGYEGMSALGWLAGPFLVAAYMHRRQPRELALLFVLFALGFWRLDTHPTAFLLFVFPMLPFLCAFAMERWRA